MELQETTKQLKKVKVDALYGKKKHFNAADRKKTYHYWLGLPVVIINLFVGSILFKILFSSEGTVLIPAVLAFIAALLSGLQTYFNFYQKAEGHRKIGNRYLTVFKHCCRIEAYIKDEVLNKEGIIKNLEDVAKEIDAINRDAEAFPTSDSDFRKAQKGIKAGEEDYTEEELRI